MDIGKCLFSVDSERKALQAKCCCQKNGALWPGQEWREACGTIAKNLEIEEDIQIFYTEAVDNGAQVGFFAPIILISEGIMGLPAVDRENVLRHECCHYKGKDLWIKLFMKGICCLVWWNPAVYLLQMALNQALELRCDRRACAGYDEKEKYLYTMTLQKLLTLSGRKFSPLAAGYGGDYHAACLKQRYRCLLGGKERKKRGFHSLFIVMAGLVVFLLSYTKIPVPCSHPSEEILEAEGDAYIIEDEVMEDFILRRTSGRLEYYKNGELVKILTEKECREEYSDIPCYDAIR